MNATVKQTNQQEHKGKHNRTAKEHSNQHTIKRNTKETHHERKSKTNRNQT